MSKTGCYLVLLVILSLLPLIFIFSNPGLVHTHDGPVHLARMAAWYKELVHGQIPPRWASELNYGYGTPILIFIYPWPYFFSFLLIKLGFGLGFAFKLNLAFSYLLAGIFCFWAVKSLWGVTKSAFLVTIFYQFMTFRLVEMNTRGALGEVWTYTFVPVVIWGMAEIGRDKKWLGFGLMSLGSALLVLSHNSVSLSFALVLALMVLFTIKGVKRKLLAYFSLGEGVVLAAFYWLPALWERKFTYSDLFMRDLYKEHFPTLGQLFLPNFLNTPAGQVGGVAVQIGLLPILGLLISLFFMRRIFIFTCLAFVVCLFLMQPISLVFWQKWALLRQFQFSWRLLSLIVLVTALTASSFFWLFKKHVWGYWLIIGLMVLSSVGYWRPPLGFDQIKEEDYWNYPLNTTYFGEANTIWAANPPAAYPERRVEAIAGRAIIEESVWGYDYQRFLVKADGETKILDRTFFFPGWRVFVNSQLWPIEFQDPGHRGLITFDLPAGRHTVKIEFGRTKDRIIGEVISLIGSLVFILAGVLSLRKQKKGQS